MKRFASIFILIFVPFLFCACKVNVAKEPFDGGLGAQISTNNDSLTEQEEINLKTKTKYVVEYIYANYEEYPFDRYVDFGPEKLVEAATTEEIEIIEEKVDIIYLAILNGESLSQQNMQEAEGATKAVQDLDQALYVIWYRESIKI